MFQCSPLSCHRRNHFHVYLFETGDWSRDLAVGEWVHIFLCSSSHTVIKKIKVNFTFVLITLLSSSRPPSTRATRAINHLCHKRRKLQLKLNSKSYDFSRNLFDRRKMIRKSHQIWCCCILFECLFFEIWLSINPYNSWSLCFFLRFASVFVDLETVLLLLNLRLLFRSPQLCFTRKNQTNFSRFSFLIFH